MNKAWFRVERPVGIDLAVLATMLVLVFLPVLQALPMPTTGDQKTYISQAVEMAQAHSWFKQTLFGQPNYYKGPLLLLCLRLGWLLFGPYTAASLIYMNVAGFAVLTFALYRLLRVRLPEDRAAGLLVPAVVVLSCGTYAHALASQMEALLITFYGLFMVLLGLAEAGERGKILRRTAWIVAGLAGLLKSPLHSVLLGTSGLLFWALTKQLVGLWQRRSEWVSLLLGVGVCTAGYAPAFLSDPRHFIASFVVREHLVRGGNGVSLLAAWLPFSFGHLLPWVPVLIVGALGWRSPPISTFSPDSRRLWQLALAMMLPTALFFSAHAYHSDLYFLPLVPSLALGFGLMVRSAVLAGSRGVLVGQWTLFTLVVVLAALVVAAVERFAPWPAWWQAGTELWIYGLFALSVSLLGLAPFLAWPTTRVRLTILGLAASFAAVGHLLVQLNAHEVQALTEATAGHEELTWGRLNLKGNVWAETGVMTVMLKHPVGGVNSSADLSKMLQPGRLFLVPDDAQLRQLQEAATAANLNVSVKAYPRWRIHGMTTKGESAWGLAWRSRRLTPLEQTEYVALTSGRAPVASIAPAANTTSF